MIKISIIFADNNIVTYEEMRKIVAKKGNGQEAIIYYVLYVPSIASNLTISRQFLDKNYTMMLEDKELKAFDVTSKLILKVPL